MYVNEETKSMDDFVNVAIRIKPHKCEKGQSLQVIANDVIFVPEKQVTYAFDKVFPENSVQESVYSEVVHPLVQRVLNGYNATIFAYGQTGTGKTYTIGSNPTYYNREETGLITRALNDIMNYDEDEAKTVTTSISFIEIYNEKVYDLLSDSKVALQLKGFNINGLTKHTVATSIDAHSLLMEGGKHRRTGETRQNAKSSRSHAIFMIYCNVKYLGQETEAKLNLVDLAGSESVKKTGNEGSQFHEGVNINKGLLYIGQVINALSNSQSYIPYRGSTITSILQDTLNTKNYVTLIACISTKLEDCTETVQTLEFAQRAKKVKNKPEMNSIISEYTKAHNIYSTKTPSKASNKVNIPTINRVPMAFRTPFTPHIQKLKRPPMNTNTIQSISNLFSSESSTIRPESSSSISTIPEAPNNLSPIVRKCMEALNSTYLQHIKEHINDIITPMVTRRNSPRISKRSLAREINNVVQSKCTKIILDETEKKTNTGSEYLDERISTAGTSPIASGNKTPMFKKPKAPFKGQKKVPPLFAASSPIRNSLRRSKRISVPNSTLTTNGYTPLSRCFTCRRSKRLSVRNVETVHNIFTSKAPKEYKPQERQLKRLSSNELKDQNHTKKVLEMINNGTVKDITGLQTIGPKCAAMIHQFRQIKGKLRKIAELSNMPWRGNGYERFVLSNFLEPATP